MRYYREEWMKECSRIFKRPGLSQIHQYLCFIHLIPFITLHTDRPNCLTVASYFSVCKNGFRCFITSFFLFMYTFLISGLLSHSNHQPTVFGIGCANLIYWWTLVQLDCEGFLSVAIELKQLNWIHY
jgi:hypothetical protein